MNLEEAGRNPAKLVQLVEERTQELKEEMEGRKRTAEELDQIYQLSYDLLCIADFNGYFKRVNPAFTKVLGYTEAELLARPFVEFVHPEDVEATLVEVEKIAGGATTLTFQNRYHCKDGGIVWLDWTSVPVVERKLMYGVARDITAQKETEEQLRRYREQLEQLVEARTEELSRANADLSAFVSTASHDLRSPLASLFSYLDLLKEAEAEKLSEEGLKFLERMEQSARRMHRLVEDLMLLSRIERMAEARELLDLGQLLESVEQELTPQLAERGAELEIPSGLPELEGTPTALAQLFTNLFTNSLKYMGEQTAPRITVGYQADNGAYHFTVTDNGIGIPVDQQERVFEPFVTLRDPRAGKVESSGVGLNIVKRIVERHGGKVWVESDGESGSVFHFTLKK